MTKRITREELFKICNDMNLWDMEKFADELERKGYIEKEILTFEKIREECIPEKSIFVDRDGLEYVFVDFYNECLIVSHGDDAYAETEESDISGWRIKK